jgi:hypothetical protein
MEFRPASEVERQGQKPCFSGFIPLKHLVAIACSLLVESLGSISGLPLAQRSLLKLSLFYRFVSYLHPILSFLSIFSS